MSRWYHNARDVGYASDDLSRFQILDSIDFQTVLDIGSGPCLLQDWLKSRGIECHYDAVDIRDDALLLCDCSTHNAPPVARKFDLVCLFGVCDYGHVAEKDSMKKAFLDLLSEACSASSHHLVFTLTKDLSISGMMGGRGGGSTVHHKLIEVCSAVSSLPVRCCVIRDTPDESEYAIICRVR